MSGIQCRCGRFLARPYARSRADGEGYSWHEFVSEVRGHCKRCGPDAMAAAMGWWWAWDAWKWADDAA